MRWCTALCDQLKKFVLLVVGILATPIVVEFFLVDSQQTDKFCVGGCKALLPHHYTYDIIMQEKIVLGLNLKLSCF